MSVVRTGKVAGVGGGRRTGRPIRSAGPHSPPPSFPSASPNLHARSAVLFPIAVTVFVTLWFINFFERLFSPLYRAVLGVNIYGLGFLTSMGFIFLVGLLASSWVGSAALSVGEWCINRLPLAKSVYSAAKQVSNALKPSADGAGSFRECVLVRHPRRDELMIGFVTGATRLRPSDGVSAPTDMLVVFVPTNHLYVGDCVLVRAADVVRTELSVRDGIEAVVSVGMSLPKALTELAPV